MAHEIGTTNGKASFGYNANHGAAWHGLGQSIDSAATIEEWIQASGLSFEVLQAAVQFSPTVDGEPVNVPDRWVNYRSDDNTALGVVSSRYKLVQPREVVEFFRDLCHANGMEMSAAGALRQGERYWATAKVPGLGCEPIQGDLIEGYILLTTSCDGSLATSVSNTATRVVCANTMRVALDNQKSAVKTRHSSGFNPTAIKEQLNLNRFAESWDKYAGQLAELVQRKITSREATDLFSELLRPTKDKAKDRLELSASSLGDLLNAPLRGANHKAPTERAIRGLEDLERSYYRGPGATPGTAYGALNGVTHFIDHVRGANPDKRTDSAWLGQGAELKTKAFDQLCAMC